MNKEILRALLIDRQLGELPPEIAELVDAYIEVEPAARTEAESTAQTMDAARETIRLYPDLLPATEAKVIPVWMWVMRAAAGIAIAAGVWFALPGRHSPPVAVNHVQNVWAQYQVTYDARRGGYVVRQQD